LHRH